MLSTKYVVSQREEQIFTLKIHLKNRILKKSCIFIKKLSLNFVEAFVGGGKVFLNLLRVPD